MRHTKTTHLIFSFILTLLFSFALVGQAFALGSATLSVGVNSGSLSVGREFQVVINANTGSTQVNAIEVGINYNSSLVSLVRSDFPSSYGYKRDDSKPGLACVTVATMGSTFSGSNAVAYLTFRVNAAGSLNLTYVTATNACYNGSPGTSILNTSQQNVWNGNTSAGSFTLLGSTSGGSTPTPTSTPKPTTNTTSSTPKPTSNTSTTTTTPKPNSNTTASTTTNQPSVQGESSSGYMIAIKVVDENNKTVVGAKVTLNGVTAVTDISGIASFTNITPGKHEAKVEYGGKKFNKMIEVKGVSTEAPQSYSIKAATTTNDYTSYAIVVGVVLLGIILIYIILKQIRKPKDHHMDGAPTTGGPSSISSPGNFSQPSNTGPGSNIGSVIGPTQISQTSASNDQSQGLNNGQH